MRILKQYAVNSIELGSIDAKTCYELSGDSSETKPTEGVADGSICTESDTGKVFFFNEKTSAWVEQFSFQS